MSAKRKYWCKGRNSYVGEGRKRIKRARCPVCNRMLTPQIRNFEPFGPFEAGYWIPPHKTKNKKDRIKYGKSS